MKNRKISKKIFSVFLLFISLLVIWSIVLAAEKPQYGGVLKIITSGGVVNLGAPGEMFTWNDGAYSMPVIEELLKYDFEGTGKVIPWLATSWEYNPEYTTLTLKLRKNVKFHDGTDFNAAAAKFSLDLNRVSNQAQLKSVSSIDVVDDYTIRLNLKEYDAGLLRNLAHNRCMIISPTSFDKEKSMLNPIGTGPFRFVSYNRDVLLKFEKFDGYWQQGKPYLDGIEFIFIADPVTSLAALKAGDAHVSMSVMPSDAVSLKASGKFNIFPNEMAILGIIGDSLHPESPFHDVRVRRAIAHALDNGAIAKACGFGFLPACNQLISYPNEGYNPNIKGYPYNPKKAKELLTEAGYPNGFNSKLLFPPYAFVGDFCTMIQGYLAKVSININLVPTQQGLFAKIRNEGWKDALIILQMPTGVEKNMTFFLRDRLSRSPAQYRNSVFIPEDYDEKLLKVNSERDDSKRVKMLQEVGEIAIDGYCLANPVLIDMSISAQNLQVHNLNAFKYYAQNWHPAEAWLVNE